MAEIIILEDHKNDLKFLQDKPPGIIVDFCKLASNLINKGCNMKLYNAAAQKLKVEVKQIQTSVEGLAYLFLEAAKYNLDKESFKRVALGLELPQICCEQIFEEYLGIKNTLEQSLPELGIQHYQFKNLEWRFETQVSSRSMIKQNEPRILMQFNFEKNGNTKQICLQSDIQNLIYMNQQINHALQDSKTNHIKRIQRTFV
ncbi:hypothetical protein RUM44_003852 [Polyplax serrata]|uniref:COMM domain-containing protein n=1 Tax=Polyplax serrata TaxID=468196 RepID=A0ABR1B152_POLSC